jgi:hypothetical protein
VNVRRVSFFLVLLALLTAPVFLPTSSRQLEFFLTHLPDALLTIMAAIPAYLFKVRRGTIVGVNVAI